MGRDGARALLRLPCCSVTGKNDHGRCGGFGDAEAFRLPVQETWHVVIGQLAETAFSANEVFSKASSLIPRVFNLPPRVGVCPR